MNRRSFLKNIGVVGLGLAFPGLAYAVQEENIQDIHSKIKRYFPNSREQVIIDGKKQILYLIKEEEKSFRFMESYFVSTSKRGFGNKIDSYKTPLGLHKISYKIGDNAIFGAIFKNWKNTGRVSKISKSKRQGLENITSRIMVLESCEKRNDNTNFRGIHIHGTSEEGLIGTPQSHGCVRINNNNIIELYSSVKIGTPVYISKGLTT